MKYLAVFAITFLATAGYFYNYENPEIRLKKQAELFCKCHNGVNSLAYLSDEFFGYLELYCNDGSEISIRGRTNEIQLGGGENCENRKTDV